jgi:hypothetical protein
VFNASGFNTWNGGPLALDTYHFVKNFEVLKQGED